jgi:hypothetical protein
MTPEQALAESSRTTHYSTVKASFSRADRIEMQGLRALAFGLGGLGILLDFTGWYTIVGGIFGLLGCSFVVMTPRSKARAAGFALNALATLVAAVILLLFFLT